MPLAPEVDLERIAATSPGMVGADLANLVNEAALLAARQDRGEVTTSDFAQSLEEDPTAADLRVRVLDAGTGPLAGRQKLKNTYLVTS